MRSQHAPDCELSVLRQHVLQAHSDVPPETQGHRIHREEAQKALGQAVGALLVAGQETAFGVGEGVDGCGLLDVVWVRGDLHGMECS